MIRIGASEGLFGALEKLWESIKRDVVLFRGGTISFSRMTVRLEVSCKCNDVRACNCKKDAATTYGSLDVPEEKRRDCRFSVTVTLQFELSG